MSENETLFKDYLGEKKSVSERMKQPKTWLIIFLILVGIVMAWVFYKSVVLGTMSPEEVSGSIELVWQDTRWVEKEVTPYETTVVPSITFKIKNTGQRPLEYVQFEGIFEIEETGKVLSDGALHAFRDRPLQPGEVSGEIFIKGNFGYTGSSKEKIMKNKEWKQIRVKLFARTKGSPPVAVGDIYPVKKVIEGLIAPEETEKKAAAIQESFDKIGKSLQIAEHDSIWVDRLKSAGRVIIVPSITFQVKNVGDEPMEDVIFKGEFVFRDSGEKLSEGVAVALEKALAPGETSKDIFLRAELGYEATSKEAFIKNIQNWRKADVRLFAKQRDYEYVLLGTFPIRQEIEGIKVIYQPQQ
jgi:hypothetical protein